MSKLGDKLGIPLILPDECLAAIGGLTSAYSYFELLAAMTVWHSLGVKPYEGTLLTGQLSLQNRLKLVGELGERNGITEADLKVISSIVTEVSKERGLSSRRNEIVHGVWSTEDPGPSANNVCSPITFSRSGKMSTGPKVDENLINQITLDVADQTRRLQTILERLGALSLINFQKPQKPSPGKPG